MYMSILKATVLEVEYSGCDFLFPISLWRGDRLISLSSMKSFARVPIDISHTSKEI